MRRVFIYSLRYWNGNINAGNAFLFGYLPLMALGVVLINQIFRLYSSGNMFLTLLSFVAGISFLMFTFIGMWRCSKYTNKALWTHITRGVIVLLTGPLIILLLMIPIFGL
jgi:hypothetical protein